MHDNAKLISQARVNERTLELYIDETITIQETKKTYRGQNSNSNEQFYS